MKMKAGFLIKIPYLKGESQEAVDKFFNSIDKNEILVDGTNIKRYRIIEIKNDWYIESISAIYDDFDADKFAMISAGNLSLIQDFSNSITSVVNYYFSTDVKVDPIVYFFSGNWTDESILYDRLVNMNFLKEHD